MTDQELLKLAQKAGRDGIWFCTTNNDWAYWNPLEDNGQAFKLAVKLHMNVETTGLYAHACGFYKSSFEWFCIQEPTGSDPYAALRRAIVRAAAEIGKEMK
jgi:hypothetical protein